ncbi:MAG: recombination protein RecR, partial [Candidatus Pacebacteria bacterium]|nr:recombination protein RecR [Candidatus Paceibacterota bacterium]
MDLPKPIKNFVNIFSKLPGMGPRQTTRLAFWLLHQKKESQNNLYHAFIDLFSKTQVCPNCFFITEIEQGEKTLSNKLCKICNNLRRDKSVICVVEKETDLLSIEKTNKYHGLYHVLGRLLSEIDENKKLRITIPQLLLRIKKQSSNNPVKEVILALSHTSEGNLTTYSLEKSIKDLDNKIKIT